MSTRSKSTRPIRSGGQDKIKIKDMKDTDKSKKKAQVQAVKDASSDVYEVQEIITMDKIGDKSVFLVSWVGYDDVTWEPASNIPSGVVKSFKAKIKQHSEKCAAGQIQECLDMVDASMDGGVSAWLFQVSWSGCGHGSLRRIFQTN